MAFHLSSRACNSHSISSAGSLFRLSCVRFQSNPPNPNHTDLSDDSSSATDSMLRKLEDAIHRIIVKRAAPDWLPFLPGSSYWVPPPRSAANSLGGIAQLVEQLANPLSDEQSLSTTTIRGWPSSDFFLEGTSPHVLEVNLTPNKPDPEAEAEAEAEATSSSSITDTTSNNVSKAEDEEG